MNRKYSNLPRILAVIGMLGLLLSTTQVALAADCTSTKAGNWDDITVWNCGEVPDVGDNVTVAHDVIVNIDASATTLIIASGGNLSLSGNLALSGNSGDVLDLQDGGIDLNDKTMTLNGDGNYNIRVANGARTITGSAGSKFLIYSDYGTNTITVASSSGGSLVFDDDVTLELSGLNNIQTRFDPGLSLTTIEGNLKISWGGQVINHGPIYGDYSTLIYSYAHPGASVSYVVGAEWPEGSSGNGIPMNVQLNTDYPGSYVTTVAMVDNTIRTLRGNMIIGTNTTLQLPSSCETPPSPPGYCGLDIYGNWINNGGTLYQSLSTVGFKGVDHQTIGGTATTNFPTLRIQNGANVELAHVTVVERKLAMASGNLNLEGFDLTLSASATITPTQRISFSATKMVVADNAALCKFFDNTYDPPPFLYPIGDDTGTAEYSPAIVNLDEVGGDGYLSYSVCVRVVNAKHPNLTTDSYFKRYWKITRSGSPTSATFDSTFYYQDADVVAIPPIYEVNFNSARFESNNATWVIYSQAVNPTDNYFTVDSVTMLNQADYTPYPRDPTAVTMAETKATAEAEQIRLQWTTAQEIGVLGFYVHRATTPDGGGRLPISDFIPSEAGLSLGASYEFSDPNVETGVSYYYWIEVVGGDGEYFGPLEAILLNRIYLPTVLK